MRLYRKKNLFKLFCKALVKLEFHFLFIQRIYLFNDNRVYNLCKKMRNTYCFLNSEFWDQEATYQNCRKFFGIVLQSWWNWDRSLRKRRFLLIQNFITFCHVWNWSNALAHSCNFLVFCFEIIGSCVLCSTITILFRSPYTFSKQIRSNHLPAFLIDFLKEKVTDLLVVQHAVTQCSICGAESFQLLSMFKVVYSYFCLFVDLTSLNF